MAAGRWALGTSRRWPYRPNSKEDFRAPRVRNLCSYAVGFAFLLLLLILGLNHPASSQFFSGSHALFLFSITSFSSPCPQCSSSPPLSLKLLPAEEKFMWYPPHSGFSNQVMELKVALAFAAVLNRTLIVPPVLDHHALALGSCPKGRLLHKADEMRAMAWAEFSTLIQKSRYVSIADIVDLSSISPRLVKTIDLRAFAALWCGVDVKPACFGPWCDALVKQTTPAWGSLDMCGALLSQALPQPACCVHGVQDDCTTTLWTFGPKRNSDRQLVVGESTGSGRVFPNPKDIVASLGPESPAFSSALLSFGSLFSMQYKGVQTHVDIIIPSGNTKLDMLLEASKYLPFTADILDAGKQYAREVIGQPFFCAQLRLLDGQFKNQWEKTFLRLEDRLERLLGEGSTKKQKVVIFVMTDLPTERWQETFLGQLVLNRTFYKLRTLSAKKELVTTTARSIITKEFGLRSGYLPTGMGSSMKALRRKPKHVPDILVNIQEVVCSCASLGFYGTPGSTLADAISDMRGSGACPS